MVARNAVALERMSDWFKRLNSLGGKKTMARLTRELSYETLRLVDEGFEKSSSPHGRKWKPWANPGDAAEGNYGPRVLERTGGLRRSVKATVGHMKFRVWTAKKHGAYHQEGRTGPWAISAKNAPSLRFFWKGKWRNRQSVQHPGYPARPFLPTGRRIPARYLKAYNASSGKVFSSIMASKRRRR